MNEPTQTGQWVGFVVRGLPVTQGSKIARHHRGHSWVQEVNGSALEQWRAAIATEARFACRDQDILEPLAGPVRVKLDFMLARPASEPKRRTWPVKARSGDLDKLARAALDAVTHVLIGDDSQVVDLHVTKDWATDGLVGVLVELRMVDE